MGDGDGSTSGLEPVAKDLLVVCGKGVYCIFLSKEGNRSSQSQEPSLSVHLFSCLALILPGTNTQRVHALGQGTFRTDTRAGLLHCIGYGW